MSAINSLIKIKFFWNLFEIGFSNHDSVSHRPISELKRLKFAQPADLPVQQAVMVTNLKSARHHFPAAAARPRRRGDRVARMGCGLPVWHRKLLRWTLRAVSQPVQPRDFPVIS